MICRRKAPYFARITVVAIAGAVITGCNTVPGAVNTAIAARLPAVLGPADSYSVSSNGSIFDLIRGKLQSVHLHGNDVQLTPFVRVDQFDADATDIHANTRTDAITKIGSVTFACQFDQNDMDLYMQTAQPDAFARGSRITLSGKDIVYSDSVGVWNIRTPFSVTGILVPHPGNPAKLDFIPSKGSLAHIAIPASVVRYLAAKQNPVVDLSQMRFPVAIDNSSVTNSRLTVGGSVDLSSLVGTSPGESS